MEIHSSRQFGAPINKDWTSPSKPFDCAVWYVLDKPWAISNPMEICRSSHCNVKTHQFEAPMNNDWTSPSKSLDCAVLHALDGPWAMSNVMETGSSYCDVKTRQFGEPLNNDSTSPSKPLNCTVWHVLDTPWAMSNIMETCSSHRNVKSRQFGALLTYSSWYSIPSPRYAPKPFVWNDPLSSVWNTIWFWVGERGGWVGGFVV